MDFSQAGKPAIASVINGYRTPSASLSYHASGKRLYVANSEESKIQVIDAFTTGRADRPSLRVEREKIHLVEASHHEDCLLFAGEGGGAPRNAVNYLSIHDNKILRKFRGHTGRLESLSQCPVDDTFLSSAADQTVRLWTLQSAGCLAECRLPAEASRTTAPLGIFDATGMVFAITAQKADLSGHYLHLYDARNYDAGAFSEMQVSTEDMVNSIQQTGISAARAQALAQQPWKSLKFNGPGNQILVTGGEGLCALLDGFEGTIQKVLMSPVTTAQRNPAVACLSSDDKMVLIGKEDGNIDCWNVDSGSLVKTLDGHNGPVSCIACNPNCSQFASSYRETALWSWS